LKLLLLKALLKGRQILVRNPMDAVDRTGVHGLLNQFGAVAVLTECRGAPPTGFKHKRVDRNVNAITATDANGLIDPDGFLAQMSAKQGFKPAGANRIKLGSNPKGQARITRSRGVWGHRERCDQAQRVTTSSIVPSWELDCSAT
jgi:hypothetical protein